jgi:integral membrane protein (TIGR01906 family)
VGDINTDDKIGGVGLKRSLILIFSLFLSIAVIGTSVRLAVGFKGIYHYDIDYLNIEEISGIERNALIENYDYLIDYNLKRTVGEFKLPSLPSSHNGRIHFEEVRAIIQRLQKVLYICVVVSAVGAIYLIRKSELVFLKLSAVITLVLPVSLAIPIAIDFEHSFKIFHKLMFDNDYWIFNPATDPVIDMLPEAYFMHEAVFIGVIIVAMSIILLAIWKKFGEKKHIPPSI